ncbi:sigma-70 family RNA polymerase sigma factor [Thalassobaculum sp.]|uniref:sigma-70 family RNA polymerase sigma factor n=1 Tax=Thalassobaculum sp. TaxID=2022740 RepID=UPI003B5A6091
MDQVYQHVEQHIRDLRRYAQALTHNPVAADDLVQESLSRALAKSYQFRPDSNLRAWLFTILHNQFISSKRHETRVGAPVDPEKAEATLSSRPNQERRLIVKALDLALHTLPMRQKQAIELVVLDGYSYEDAADVVDVPIGTIKSRIARGRDTMREYLDA